MSALELVVVCSDGIRHIPLTKFAKLTIGRDASNDICLPDLTVSERHAVLYIEQPLRLVDLGSLNGMRVSSQGSGTDTALLVEHHILPGKSYHIKVGDGVHFGTSMLIFRHPTRTSHKTCNYPIKSAGEHEVQLVFSDPKMTVMVEEAIRMANSDLNMFLLGETGSGKEVLAKLIHSRSSRNHGPFICINCAALTESLVESELFGHEPGAFTGAHRTKPGLLETANGGTLLLDEIGELSPSIQAKLLRVIEEQKILRVGGIETRHIDIRIVSATNRDLKAAMIAGAFREDLFFRLCGSLLTIPPLRTRPADIEILARHFLAKIMDRAIQKGLSAHARRPRQISKEGIEKLNAYSWPGNVRQLRAVVERAAFLCGDEEIRPEHLELMPLESIPPESTAYSPPLPIRVRSSELVRERVSNALEHCGGNQTRAAQMLGISRGTLLSLLDVFKMKRPRKRRPNET